MINFKNFKLDNGLKVIVHEDNSTPLACVNILYNVGSRDEDSSRTGFAHLFEHLMFGGSINIENYDEPLQKVGGENNAFTTNDITNYYVTLPASNIETAFWLESDRMLGLSFSDKSLEVQKNVVIEEFKQRYLNQPYGDVWLNLRPLAYKTHPYQWDTIGKEIAHIENATMEEVKAFFKKFYCPNNAIMVVAGNVNIEQIEELSQKWFGPIPRGPENNRNLPVESQQLESRKLEVHRNVPFDAIYKAYHMCSRLDKDYYSTDLISDVLSRGKSSRLYKKLVKEKKMFSEINAYILGSTDQGLLIISGKLVKGIKMLEAEMAIEVELDQLKKEILSEQELTKVKNKVEASLVFSEMEILTRAMNLAVFELLGDANLANTEVNRYNAVTASNIKDQANIVLQESNCSTLYYYSQKKN